MYIASKDESLTERQTQLLNFLRDHQREHGVMPSTREIQRFFGFASQTAAMSHLRALEKKGVIQRYAGKARAVVFPGDLDRPEVMNIPIYGDNNSDEQQQSSGCMSVDIATLGVPRGARTFALKVHGDSMVGAHIIDGDHVVLEVKEPQPRDIVAAVIDGQSTLKRYVVRNGLAYLKAENLLSSDLIPISDLVIQGVMVALVRHSPRFDE
jgi:repressor LexA